MNELIKISEHNGSLLIDKNLIEKIARVQLQDSQQYLTFFEILEITAELAFRDVDAARRLLPAIKVHPLFREYVYLVDAVEASIFRSRIISYGITERRLRDKFLSELHLILPGAEVVNFKSDRYNMPDLVVRYLGALTVIEFKKDFITGSAVRQIKRYMETYDFPKGYLVAPKMKDNVRLPVNVQFISFTLNPNTEKP